MRGPCGAGWVVHAPVLLEELQIDDRRTAIVGSGSGSGLPARCCDVGAELAQSGGRGR